MRAKGVRILAFCFVQFELFKFVQTSFAHTQKKRVFGQKRTANKAETKQNAKIKENSEERMKKWYDEYAQEPENEFDECQLAMARTLKCEKEFQSIVV